MAARDLLAGEALKKSADSFERRVIVVGGVDGKELDDYVVFELAGARVADAVGEGSAALEEEEEVSGREGRLGEEEGARTSMAMRIPGMVVDDGGA